MRQVKRKTTGNTGQFNGSVGAGVTPPGAAPKSAHTPKTTPVGERPTLHSRPVDNQSSPELDPTSTGLTHDDVFEKTGEMLTKVFEATAAKVNRDGFEGVVKIHSSTDLFNILNDHPSDYYYVQFGQGHASGYKYFTENDAVELWEYSASIRGMIEKFPDSSRWNAASSLIVVCSADGSWQVRIDGESSEFVPCRTTLD